MAASIGLYRGVATGSRSTCSDLRRGAARRDENARAVEAETEVNLAATVKVTLLWIASR
jgi:hypothetical protein